jgi:hypothetical protein
MNVKNHPERGRGIPLRKPYGNSAESVAPNAFGTRDDNSKISNDN